MVLIYLCFKDCQTIFLAHKLFELLASVLNMYLHADSMIFLHIQQLEYFWLRLRENHVDYQKRAPILARNTLRLSTHFHRINLQSSCLFINHFSECIMLVHQFCTPHILNQRPLFFQEILYLSKYWNKIPFVWCFRHQVFLQSHLIYRKQDKNHFWSKWIFDLLFSLCHLIIGKSYPLKL